jgi:hypothetical protein
MGLIPENDFVGFGRRLGTGCPLSGVKKSYIHGTLFLITEKYLISSKELSTAEAFCIPAPSPMPQAPCSASMYGK